MLYLSFFSIFCVNPVPFFSNPTPLNTAFPLKIFPSISLDTVNRTLLTLNEIGAAFTIIGSGDARRYDGGLHEHQHFKCVKCKRIIDFHHKPFDNIKPPADISKKFKVLFFILSPFL